MGTAFQRRTGWVPNPDDINFFDTVLAILAFIGMCSRHIFSLFSDVLILLHCLVVWLPSRALNRLIREEILHLDEVTPKGIFIKNSKFIQSNFKILENYDALKDFCALVNDVIGPLILVYTADNLLFYSTMFNSIFQDNGYLHTFRQFLFYALTALIVICCGEICRQIEIVVLWLTKNRTANQLKNVVLDVEHLTLILHEVKEHTIGISGVVFVMDYSAVLNVSFDFNFDK